MTKIKNPCGCVADDSKWLELCKEHEALHNWRTQESNLGSLWDLIVYYERHPIDDNLKHVILRIKAHGGIITKHEQIKKWIVEHASLIRGGLR